eukprot:1161625-Pelagomonas_calceolata.AAC.15
MEAPTTCLRGCTCEAVISAVIRCDDGPLQLACEAARVKLRALSGSSTDLTAMADVAAEKNGQKGAQLGESEEDIDAAVRRVRAHNCSLAWRHHACLPVKLVQHMFLLLECMPYFYTRGWGCMVSI